MKRRSFFALVCGGIAGLFGIKQKPKNQFILGQRDRISGLRLLTDKEFEEIWKKADAKMRANLGGLKWQYIPKTRT